MQALSVQGRQRLSIGLCVLAVLAVLAISSPGEIQYDRQSVPAQQHSASATASATASASNPPHPPTHSNLNPNPNANGNARQSEANDDEFDLQQRFNEIVQDAQAKLHSGSRAHSATTKLIFASSAVSLLESALRVRAYTDASTQGEVEDAKALLEEARSEQRAALRQTMEA